MNNKKFIISTVLFVIATLVIAFFISQLTGEVNTSYNDLQQPPLSPPGIVFPIVWTILYVLLGITASYLYNNDYTKLFGAFLVQMAFNFSWTWLFFNMNNYILSIIWICIMIILTMIIILSLKNMDQKIYVLLIPYIIWLCFALYLSIGIYILN